MQINRRQALQAVVGGGFVAGTLNIFAAEPKLGMGAWAAELPDLCAGKDMGPGKAEELDLWERIEVESVDQADIWWGELSMSARFNFAPLTNLNKQNIKDFETKYTRDTIYPIHVYNKCAVHMEKLSPEALASEKRRMEEAWIPRLREIDSDKEPIVYTVGVQDSWTEFKHFVFGDYHGLLAIKHHHNGNVGWHYT